VTASATTALLEITGAVKSFGAVQALQAVDLRLDRGEILALLGDNGAGKSTLIKCISGVHTLDAGALSVEGKPARIRRPADARSLGVETVYQDLALFDNLTAAQNFFAGREVVAPRWLAPFAFMRESAMARKTEEIIQRLQVGVEDLHAPLALMSGGQRQAIAVARAVAFATKIVILDEPTAALGIRESRNVIELVRRLPEQGVSVIVISHNLEEVMQVADRAVVLRRGRLVGEAAPTPENHSRLVSLIVGADDGGGWMEKAPQPAQHHNRS
jgi:D-xylose transport system ATP-binding protein